MRDNAEYAAGDKERDINKYVEYLYGQTEELLTQFGKIDILWYDFSVGPSARYPGKGKDVWRSEELISRIRKLQPGIIIDDRLQIDQDVKTPEQYMPREWVRVGGQPVVWEGCHTFSGSWGYHRDEESWKSSEQLIIMLIDSVSKGGNLLLNVGRRNAVNLTNAQLDRLQAIGKWMKRHSRFNLRLHAGARLNLTARVTAYIHIIRKPNAFICMSWHGDLTTLSLRVRWLNMSITFSCFPTRRKSGLTVMKTRHRYV